MEIPKEYMKYVETHDNTCFGAQKYMKTKKYMELHDSIPKDMEPHGNAQQHMLCRPEHMKTHENIMTHLYALGMKPFLTSAFTSNNIASNFIFTLTIFLTDTTWYNVCCQGDRTWSFMDSLPSPMYRWTWLCKSREYRGIIFKVKP